VRSLVDGVKDLLFSPETAICDLELRFVEWLGLVEVVAIGGTVHVRVKVLLSLPLCAVPKLTVALVAAGHGVRTLVDLQLGAVFEGRLAVSAPPVGLVVGLGAEEAGTRRRREVVLGLVVARRIKHGARTVTSTAHLHRLIVLWNQLSIESIDK